jgi:predicted RNA-binding Zn-ribbon protein involved in translation (DUF1610 family)
MCGLFKPASSFENSSDWQVLCSECQAKAKENFYNRIKSGETCKHTRPPKRIKRRAPEKPVDSVHKRCPSCNTHLWVVQTERSMRCWKCGQELRIAQALRDSTYHRHGVILSVVL